MLSKETGPWNFIPYLNSAVESCRSKSNLNVTMGRNTVQIAIFNDEYEVDDEEENE